VLTSVEIENGLTPRAITFIEPNKCLARRAVSSIKPDKNSERCLVTSIDLEDYLIRRADDLIRRILV